MLQTTAKPTEVNLSANAALAHVVAQAPEKAPVCVPKTAQEKQDFNRLLEAYNDCV